MMISIENNPIIKAYKLKNNNSWSLKRIDFTNVS